jgi:hypothetical protein
MTECDGGDLAQKDYDGDGIPNYRDPDIDGDGYANTCDGMPYGGPSKSKN